MKYGLILLLLLLAYAAVYGQNSQKTINYGHNLAQKQWLTEIKYKGETLLALKVERESANVHSKLVFYDYYDPSSLSLLAEEMWNEWYFVDQNIRSCVACKQ